MQPLVIAILVKNKERFLPLYLLSIENQTYPAEYTHLYIRTNNNTDNTIPILQEWIQHVQHRYASIHFNAEDVPEPVEQYGEHEWNAVRFAVLGKIRQESIEYAKQLKAHYLVIDCDNLVVPETAQRLLDTGVPVVAPLLLMDPASGSRYSNFHHCTDSAGYFKSCSEYNFIWDRSITGLIQCNVIHCTYLIRQEYLQYVSYLDGSSDYEYVIFSRVLRDQHIPQYMDNRFTYGYLTLNGPDKVFSQESWVDGMWRQHLSVCLHQNHRYPMVTAY